MPAPGEGQVRVRDGVSGFTLVSDDLHAIQRYGRQVVPALREVVARERRPAASA